MSQLAVIVKRAAKLAVPSPAETAEIDILARRLLRKIRQSAGGFPEVRGVLIGGSFAKGTWLPKHVDLDFFVKFDPTTPLERFEKAGLDIGRAATRGYQMGKKYAQHPYTEATVEGVRVNIVPCFAVKAGEWKSAADRSPYHVELVRRLPDDRKNQIRILKLFMNGVGAYGAEIQRQGFSGYVAEVLVIKHGDFESVVRWFAGCNVPANGRVFSLPDPVDEGRDLGIAVSGDSLGRMVLACRGFLRRPRLAYFGEMKGRVHPSLDREVYAIVFSHKEMSEDTLWGELRKTLKHVVRHLEVQGFAIARAMAASDNTSKSAILLIPEFEDLPPVEQRVGPTVDRRKDVEAFISTNSRQSRLVWVDDDARVRLLRPRRYTRLADLLSDVIGGKAGPIGASKEVEDGMKTSGTVLRGRNLTKAASSSKWLSDGIREITSDAIGTR
jgi:tRNA nucleotidyltransferase (CCA-adding enzyme)